MYSVCVCVYMCSNEAGEGLGAEPACTVDRAMDSLPVESGDYY